MPTLMDLIMQEYGGQNRPAIPSSTILPSFAQGQASPTLPMSIGSMGGQPMMGAFPPTYTPPQAAPVVMPSQRPLPEILASRDERTMVPKREPGFFERLFQGTDFQSNSMPVTMTLPSTAEAPPQYINFGDAANAADFFRADRALMQQNPAMFGLLGGSNG